MPRPARIRPRSDKISREAPQIRDPGGRLGLAALGQFGLTWLAERETGLENGFLPPLKLDCRQVGSGGGELEACRLEPTSSFSTSREPRLRRQASSAPSRGTSSSTARSSCSLPARADREQCMILGRGVRLTTSEPAWPLLVANCCALWQLLATRTEARLLLRARRPWLIF